MSTRSEFATFIAYSLVVLLTGAAGFSMLQGCTPLAVTKDAALSGAVKAARWVCATKASPTGGAALVEVQQGILDESGALVVVHCDWSPGAAEGIEKPSP